MARKSKPKTFGEMFVAKLDKRVKIEDRWVSQRTLLLQMAVERARAGDAFFQKLLLPIMQQKPPVIIADLLAATHARFCRAVEQLRKEREGNA